MSVSTRKVRCRRCGCIQELSNAVCKDCGDDLLLYGEILRETQRAVISEEESVGVKAARKSAVRLLSKTAAFSSRV